MRLLKRAPDGTVHFTQDIVDDTLPEYGILSHTWLSEAEEVKYEDVLNGTAQTKTGGYSKIQFCSDKASKDGLELFWVDTCCINKNSGPEVQEAITSMFSWYRKSTHCYVHLSDVSVTKDEIEAKGSVQPWETAFRRSRWFSRGWTLQELLAPFSVKFYSAQGVYLGDKRTLEGCIREVTQIPREALRGSPLTDFSVNERMSWASHRKTTREEDAAYALLGLFGIFMPLMYGEGDNAFVRLRECIDKRNGSLETLDPLLESLPTASQAAFNSLTNQHSPPCLPGTRVELLQKIEDWIQGDDKRCIFWLSGVVGTGKSTVARTIARRYYDQNMLGGSFFFCRGGGEASRAAMLCTTIASQLASTVPSLRSYISQAILGHQDIALKSLRDQWEQLIIGPLSKLRSKTNLATYVIVIDALDECDSETDIRVIIKLLLMASTLRNIRLRIFITSRSETTIESGFAQVPGDTRQVCVLHDISSKLVDRDLTLFFTESFAVIRQERGWPMDWPNSLLIQRLVKISCGLFIWASIACRYIRDGKQLAKQRVLKLVNGKNSGVGPQKQLDEIYTTVLRDSTLQDYDEDEKRVFYNTLRKVLGSIITLFYPLSANALTNLIQEEATHVDETLADLHTILRVPEEKDRPIWLHHPSFRDFLLDKTRCGDPNFWIDEKERQQALADYCIALMSKKLRQNICELRSPGTLSRDVPRALVEQCIPPELQYACIYWVDHYRLAGTHMGDGDSVHHFLRKHFLHWLEAISLFGEVSQASALIRLYHALLPPAKSRKQDLFVKNCRRFIYDFQTIIERAPLQVYCAGLVFLSPSNGLRQHFWSQLHPCLKLVQFSESVVPEVRDEYNYVNNLSFTPDGQQIASGSNVKAVRVWHVEEKTPYREFVGQERKVSSVAFSSNGKMLASGSDDATVMIWDATTGAVIHHLKGHSRWVNEVTFSPDDQFIASGSMDQTLRIWDLRDGKELCTLEGNSSYVNSIAFCPDGLLIASASADHMVRLWNVREKELHSILDGHSGPVTSVRFSPDGSHIVTGSNDKTVRIWDVIRGVELRQLKGHTGRVTAVAVSNNGRQIASCSDDKMVRLWDPAGEHLMTMEGHTCGINAIAYAPDNQLLATCSFDDEVRVWNTSTGHAVGKLADFDGLIESHRQSSTASLSTIAHSGKVMCLAFSPDGNVVASGSRDTTIKLWTRKGGRLQILHGHADSVTQLTFSAASETLLLASASRDTTVKIWNAGGGLLLRTFAGHTDAVCSIRFSYDGSILASCSSDTTIILWDLATGLARATLKGHENVVDGIAFAPDDQLMASYSKDMTVRLWDTKTGEQAIAPLLGHRSVALSANGDLLGTCSRDNTLRIWTTLGLPYFMLPGHTLPIHHAAFSRDDKTVISCSEDKTIRVWDLETRLVRVVLRVDTMVRQIGSSSSGNYIETDRGTLNLGERSRLANSTDLSEAQSLFVADEWLRRENENILWIPAGFRELSVAVRNGTAVLGHFTGSLFFIEC